MRWNNRNSELQAWAWRQKHHRTSCDTVTLKDGRSFYVEYTYYDRMIMVMDAWLREEGVDNVMLYDTEREEIEATILLTFNESDWYYED